LVVDDRATFLSLFEKLLGERMEVRTARTGAKALALIDGEDFDVVVTDVRMPGMDGMTLLEQIKARRPEIQVILMTAYGAIPDAVRAMQRGAFHYLTKPFDPDDALHIIEQAVSVRRAQLSGADPANDARAKDAEGQNPAALAERGVNPPLGLADLTYRDVIDSSRDRATREYLVELLRAVRGNVTRAAQRAAVERESLHRLMRRYDLRAEDFRDKR